MIVKRKVINILANKNEYCVFDIKCDACGRILEKFEGVNYAEAVGYPSRKTHLEKKIWKDKSRAGIRFEINVSGQKLDGIACRTEHIPIAKFNIKMCYQAMKKYG